MKGEASWDLKGKNIADVRQTGSRLWVKRGRGTKRDLREHMIGKRRDWKKRKESSVN